MTVSDELAIQSYFNEAGKLFSPTRSSEWDRPERVELTSRLGGMMDTLYFPLGSELRIHKQSNEGARARVVKPASDLLEKFITLAESNDVRLLNFARRFGSLEIFSGPTSTDDGNARVEYCAVWRYFARVVMAVLKIAARPNADGKNSEPDWDVIGDAPQVIRDWHKREQSKRLLDDPEIFWSAVVFFIRERKDRNRNRKILVQLLNTLLQLGQVRPWVLWPEGTGRPRVVYSSPRLLSYLALQLSLRIGGLTAFVPCHECRKEYTPPQRAPKAGQRNFCPECQKAGIPQKYALKDYRERKRKDRVPAVI